MLSMCFLIKFTNRLLLKTKKENTKNKNIFRKAEVLLRSLREVCIWAITLSIIENESTKFFLTGIFFLHNDNSFFQICSLAREVRMSRKEDT